MPGPNGRMAPAAAEPEGEEGPTLEIGMEDSIAAPNTTGRRGCMKDLKEGEEIRWKGLPPLGVHDEEQERLARQTSPAPALEEQTIEERERLARQTSPAPALEEQTIEERLHHLDLKMEKLSLQMTECVAGIRAVYLKRYRHIRPPPMTDTLIPVPEQHAQSSIRLAEGRDGREGSSARSSVGSNRSSLSVDGHDGFVPALRLLKTWRRFQQIHLLTKAFKLAFEALPVMLFIYIVVWLFFTAAMFVAEDRNDIQTLGQAMWLTFCSMTSSMFGDLYPKSDFGKVIISALVLISTLYMAIPIGIIGTCFSEVWADRDRILLVERMRRVFKQNGFTANDIPDLFSHFDVDCSGLLNLEEFKSMASILKLGLSEDRLLSLFNMFDDDGSGGIDEREFCRAIFPEAYCCLYGDRGLEKSNSFKNLRRLSVSLFQSFAGNGGN